MANNTSIHKVKDVKVKINPLVFSTVIELEITYTAYGVDRDGNYAELNNVDTISIFVDNDEDDLKTVLKGLKKHIEV